MLTHRIVPCLDTAGGRVQKGVQFVGLRDCGDPAELAARYAAQGADELVLLDIAATPAAREHRLDTVRAVRRALGIPLCVGGGVRSVADAHGLLAAGADKVAVNSAAVARPALLTELAAQFGSQAVVLAIDARRVGDRFVVHTHAGSSSADTDVVPWATAAERLGAGELLLTSIDRDGTGAGYDLELLAAVRAATSLPIVASGGGRTAAQLAAALRAGADAVLIASVLHDGVCTVDDLKRELLTQQLPIRP